MANRLKMAEINAIHTLHESGYSGRKIAAIWTLIAGRSRNMSRNFKTGQTRPPAPERTNRQRR